MVIKKTNTINKILSTLLLSVLILSMLFLMSQQAQAKPNWNTWVAQLRSEAINQGIRPQLFDTVFANIHQPNRRILHFDKTQPERRITFRKYRRTRIDPYRITLGKREYKRNYTLLNNVGRDFGVDPCFITAIWGIETSYGRYMGTFPVVNALATLAYDDRRADYFRKELLLALHILNDGHVPLSKFKGEWAGASGYPQFMPSSWRKYAVDYNHDGKKDIWTNYGDAFASIANYLKINGWHTGQPWSLEVTLPSNINKSLIGYDHQMTVKEWERLGVKPKRGFHFPNQNLMASVLRPYGGPDLMIFNNFKVLLKYNNSTFYAGSVGYLADKICGRQ